MDNLLDFLTSKEIIIVYIIAGVACLVCFIVYLVEKNNTKFKQRQNTRELNKLVDQIKDEVGETEVVKEDKPILTKIEETPIAKKVDTTKSNNIINNVSTVDNTVREQVVIDPISVEQEDNSNVITSSGVINDNQVEDLEEEELQYTDIEPDQQTAKLELKKITEELMKQEKLEQERIEKERLEKEKLEKERIEREKLEQERLEKERLEKEKLEKERLERERLEQERIRLQKEALEQEKLRLEQQKLEQQKLEKEKVQNNNIELTDYEVMQEEEAIISLEELINKSKAIYAANELSQYADEGNEPISLQELEKRANTKVDTTQYEEPFIIEDVVDSKEIEESQEVIDNLRLEEFNTVMSVSNIEGTDIKKFKSSPIISPIYGIEKDSNSNELELENTANYEKLDEEIRKTNEFLMTLRELQKKLD